MPRAISSERPQTTNSSHHEHEIHVVGISPAGTRHGNRIARQAFMSVDAARVSNVHLLQILEASAPRRASSPSPFPVLGHKALVERLKPIDQFLDLVFLGKNGGSGGTPRKGKQAMAMATANKRWSSTFLIKPGLDTVLSLPQQRTHQRASRPQAKISRTPLPILRDSCTPFKYR